MSEQTQDPHAHREHKSTDWPPRVRVDDTRREGQHLQALLAWREAAGVDSLRPEGDTKYKGGTR